MQRFMSKLSPLLLMACCLMTMQALASFTLLRRDQTHHGSTSAIEHKRDVEKLDATSNVPPKGGFGPIEVVPAPEDGIFTMTYPRFVQLGKGKILMTFSDHNMSIFESLDYGKTWRNSTTIKYKDAWAYLQPSFLVLPAPLGKLPKGTVLLAFNAFLDTVTEIVLFASSDEGKTWSFISVIAGGANRLAHGKKGPPNFAEQGYAIFEPFLLYHDNQLTCYFSNERDPEHSQKISSQSSKNGIHWEDSTDAISETDYKGRPGTFNLALMNNKEYIAVYADDQLNSTEKSPIHLRRSTDPLAFNKAEAFPIKVSDGTFPVATPTVAFTPFGGPKGTLAVLSLESGNVMLSHTGGEGPWTNFTTKSHQGYSQGVAIADWADDILLIASGAKFRAPGAKSPFGVTFTAVELPASGKA